MTDAVTEAKEGKRFTVFSETDLNNKGKVSSAYPAFYYSHFRETLEESVRMLTYQLDHDLIPKSEIGEARSRLDRESKKLTEIKESIPRIAGQQKDRIKSAVDILGGKISEAMFTRDEMEKGTADVKEEMERMTIPCIEVKDDKTYELLRACNVRIDKDRRVTRTEAERAWKIGRRLLGERTNTEALRR